MTISSPAANITACAAVRGRGVAHDERRGAILEAVFDIIDAEGAGQVSIRHVAERAGVSAGRVQHYFPTKDDLLTAAFTAISEHGTARHGYSNGSRHRAGARTRCGRCSLSSFPTPRRIASGTA